jgi:cytochrome c553
MRLCENVYLRACCAGLVLLLLLAGCSGGSEAQNTAKPDLTPPASNDTARALTYSGPAPVTTDVQQFKLNIWDNLAGTDRCGSCHQQDGSGVGAFVRNDDINQAYAVANPLVNLSAPSSSRLVSKVAGGHNCWLASDTACGDIISGYILAWAGTASGSAQIVSLAPPEFYQVGNSRSFAADGSEFSTLLWQPLLRIDETRYCARCHSEDAATPQQPYFASSDLLTAYAAAQTKIDLDNPAQSRLVLRLRDESHHCWNQCASDADTMEAVISALAAGSELQTIAPDRLVSGALVLTRDGIVASSGGRIDDNVIASYSFKAGEGATAFDTSGVNPALNLNLTGSYSWESAWGIRFNGARAQGLTRDSRKLFDLITATGEYSIETWVAPANVTQDDVSRIISYSGGDFERNFTLGQSLYNYDFLNRSVLTDVNGLPALSTPNADEVLQATLQHVVVSYDPVNGRRIFVNGQAIDVVDGLAGGGLDNWNDSFALMLGDEVSGNHPWQGTVRFLAIHNRALGTAQVEVNYLAGVGQKYFLLFALSEAGLVDQPSLYLKFQVAQFDNYSYLFSDPELISLAPDSAPVEVSLAGLRIGVNGREVTTGQSYARLSGAFLVSQTGSPSFLSTVGTLIGQEKGPGLDEFFLSFDEIGSRRYARPVVAVAATPVAADLPGQSAIGVRNFNEIDASLANLTRVPAGRLFEVFQTLKQQLPVDERPGGFVTAHQMAVTQLTVAYCQELVVDPLLRQPFFAGFDFNEVPAVAFSTSGRRVIIDSLTAQLSIISAPSALTTQPAVAEIEPLLNQLIDELLINASADTQAIVMASCAAAFGNAAMLVQ